MAVSPKSKNCWITANNVDPDQMLYSVDSDLGLHYLLRRVDPNTCTYGMNNSSQKKACNSFTIQSPFLSIMILNWNVQ